MEILKNFGFTSDHRVGKRSIKIQLNPQYKNKQKNNRQAKMVIPVHKYPTVNTILENEQKSSKFKTTDQVQNIYGVLKGTIQYTIKKVGNSRTIIKTDKKLSEDTRKLLEKRRNQNSKPQKTALERLELRELRKLVRRKIRQDIKYFEESTVEEIIKNSGSIKLARKQIQRGSHMFIKLKDNEGEIKYVREEISDIASAFYKNLCMDNRVTEKEFWRSMVINKDLTPPFLKEEVVNVL